MIETVLKFLNRVMTPLALLPVKYVPQDKQMHFISGALLCVILIICHIPAIFATILVSITGVIKETYDYYHPLLHTCDVYDWLATTLGGLFILLVVTL